MLSFAVTLLRIVNYPVGNSGLVRSEREIETKDRSIFDQRKLARQTQRRKLLSPRF
jgi:hypothetical protein